MTPHQGESPSEPPGRREASREELEAAFQQATRTARRSSFLGALGFGAALLMFVLLAERGPTPSPTPFSIEHMLIAGGVAGGVLFTMVASRASRTAKACQQRLDGDS